jgi:hypothetical protein
VPLGRRLLSYGTKSRSPGPPIGAETSPPSKWRGRIRIVRARLPADSGLCWTARTPLGERRVKA